MSVTLAELGRNLAAAERGCLLDDALQHQTTGGRLGAQLTPA